MADDDEKKWGGSAGCTIIKDGKKETLSCDVGYDYKSKTDAETALNLKIQGLVNQSGGQTQGEIKVDARIKW